MLYCVNITQTNTFWVIVRAGACGLMKRLLGDGWKEGSIKLNLCSFRNAIISSTCVLPSIFTASNFSVCSKEAFFFRRAGASVGPSETSKGSVGTLGAVGSVGSGITSEDVGVFLGVGTGGSGTCFLGEGTGGSSRITTMAGSVLGCSTGTETTESGIALSN